MEVKVYNQEGKEAGDIKLPKNIFGLPWNSDLVHQVVFSMKSNERKPIAHTKSRGEVSGGGKKPWRQKGTGRARHGSTRSPIWIGGGVAHGPRNDKDYSKKINKKMRVKALFCILSKKLKDGELFFIDKIDLKESKTKESLSVLKSIKNISGLENILKKRKNSALITVNKKDEKVKRGFANFSNIELETIKDINPVNVMNFKHLIISNPKESLDFLSKKIS